jgi:hypothetical protein
MCNVGSCMLFCAHVFGFVRMCLVLSACVRVVCVLVCLCAVGRQFASGAKLVRETSARSINPLTAYISSFYAHNAGYGIPLSIVCRTNRCVACHARGMLHGMLHGILHAWHGWSINCTCTMRVGFTQAFVIRRLPPLPALRAAATRHPLL